MLEFDDDEGVPAGVDERRGHVEGPLRSGAPIAAEQEPVDDGEPRAPLPRVEEEVGGPIEVELSAQDDRAGVRTSATQPSTDAGERPSAATSIGVAVQPSSGTPSSRGVPMSPFCSPIRES